MQTKTWVFPPCETTRIACHAAAAVRVAYDAARRRIATLGAQDDCTLTLGVLDGQFLLVFAWDSAVDARLPAIVDALAVLAGGSAVLQEASVLAPNHEAGCPPKLEKEAYGTSGTA